MPSPSSAFVQKAKPALASPPQPWPKPKRFDRNLVVIGAGAAGLVAAYIAAAAKAKVSLVEKHRMGGDCLNTGCVPSKALIRTARLLAQIRRAGDFGIHVDAVELDFPRVMDRVRQVIEAVAPHDSIERYTGLGVEVIQGTARLLTPWTVEIETAAGQLKLTTQSIVIAAGARPWVPPIHGLEQAGYLTSDSLWDLRVLPKRLVVLGGGPIGCELAQCFARFGSKVTIVEMQPRLLPREDLEISAMLADRFHEEGIDLRLGYRATRVIVEDGQKCLLVEQEGRETRIAFDAILVAVGRIANTEGYGLEELGIGTTPARTLQTNGYLQTLHPNIYACGDVAGPFQFTHAAAHQAWHVAANALLGGAWRFKVDYSVLPWATFTDPEVARVGLNEWEAQQRGIAYESSVFRFADLDRAIAEGETSGMVKVLTPPGKDKILGVTIMGAQAGELIAEFVLAMKHGIGLTKLLSTIHIYPTLAEANKAVASAWKRAHTPPGLLAWLKRYHAWRRG